MSQKSSQANLLDKAVIELKLLNDQKSENEGTSISPLKQRRLNPLFEESKLKNFPTACLRLVEKLPGNKQCIDCGEPSPQWASLSYGCLLCLNCSGRHRSFGVVVSKVRSVAMDSWSHSQVLSMLEGGNSQLENFFMRHSLTPQSFDDSSHSDLNLSAHEHGEHLSRVDSLIGKRYKTKAAKFYRDQLALHVQRIVDSGEYQGREASRLMKTCAKPSKKIKSKEIRAETTISLQKKSTKEQTKKVFCLA
mmetsp:Transcript_9281/g.13159  ORF Transcript_9281/g.13159 Transcript_9281/m.13159 type:complete len:249 (-) Transcript_9281:172-918(-)